MLVKSATDDPSTKAVPHQEDVSPASVSCPEQTDADAAVPPATPAAEAAYNSTQQDSAGADAAAAAAAAADSPHKLSAGLDPAQYDQLATLLLSRKSPAETPKNLSSWRPCLAKMEGSTLRCLAVTQAELAEHAPHAMTPSDKLAVSTGPPCGKVDGPISSSSDMMDAGSSEGSNLPLMGPSEVKDPYPQQC